MCRVHAQGSQGSKKRTSQLCACQISGAPARRFRDLSGCVCRGRAYDDRGSDEDHRRARLDRQVIICYGAIGLALLFIIE